MTEQQLWRTYDRLINKVVTSKNPYIVERSHERAMRVYSVIQKRIAKNRERLYLNWVQGREG